MVGILFYSVYIGKTALDKHLAGAQHSQERDKGKARRKVKKHAEADRYRERWECLLVDCKQENGSVHALSSYVASQQNKNALVWGTSVSSLRVYPSILRRLTVNTATVQHIVVTQSNMAIELLLEFGMSCCIDASSWLHR